MFLADLVHPKLKMLISRDPNDKDRNDISLHELLTQHRSHLHHLFADESTYDDDYDGGIVSEIIAALLTAEGM